jgi:uncharacterized protein (DUF433 family)
VGGIATACGPQVRFGRMNLNWAVRSVIEGEPMINPIVSTPGVCGGKPRISGHRIRVEDVAVWHEVQGLQPEAIVARYPQLTFADVYAALAYYYDHRDEIRRSMEEDAAYAESVRAKIPSKLPR